MHLPWFALLTFKIVWIVIIGAFESLYSDGFYWDKTDPVSMTLCGQTTCDGQDLTDADQYWLGRVENVTTLRRELYLDVAMTNPRVGAPLVTPRYIDDSQQLDCGLSWDQ